MQSKTQLCRYYQRGTCQYGARCKFLHEKPQPSKPVNPFGFGTGAQQQQQQQPTSVQPPKNPFDFGAQNSQSQQSRPTQQQQNPPNPFGFGVKGNNNASSKPFENKWSRFSANQAATSSRQADAQLPSATHSCTDPDTCKRQIAEDFQHEKPLWKLTCYGHHKCAPCDIIGDVSYEELRFSAYNDAKSGMSLSSIAEKERQLMNAKMVEFESLLRNPYKGPASSITSQSPFPQAAPNAFSSIANNQTPFPQAAPNAFSSIANNQSPFPQATPNAFSSIANNQSPFPPAIPNAFSSIGNNVSSPSTWTFGQAASSLNQGSGINATSSSPNTGYKQAGLFQNSGPTPSIFGTQNSTIGGLSSLSAQLTASPFGPSKPSFPNNFMSTSSSTSLHSSNSIISNSPIQTGPSHASMETVKAETAGFINNTQPSDVSVDDKIWLKEKWHPGEIPETPPPERFVF